MRHSVSHVISKKLSDIPLILDKSQIWAIFNDTLRFQMGIIKIQVLDRENAGNTSMCCCHTGMGNERIIPVTG